MFTLYVNYEKDGNYEKYDCFDASEEGIADFKRSAQINRFWDGFYYLRPDTEKAEALLIKHNLI